MNVSQWFALTYLGSHLLWSMQIMSATVSLMTHYSWWTSVQCDHPEPDLQLYVSSKHHWHITSEMLSNSTKWPTSLLKSYSTGPIECIKLIEKSLCASFFKWHPLYTELFYHNEAYITIMLLMLQKLTCHMRAEDWKCYKNICQSQVCVLFIRFSSKNEYYQSRAADLFPLYIFHIIMFTSSSYFHVTQLV